MKISKSLLQSIALGVTLGALGTSCTSSVLTPILDDSEQVHPVPNDEVGEEGTCEDWGDCPACGLG